MLGRNKRKKPLPSRTKNIRLEGHDDQDPIAFIAPLKDCQISTVEPTNAHFLDAYSKVCTLLSAFKRAKY